jgi:hypothetical protein
MAMTEAKTALIGVFPDRRRAEHFVAELKRAGFGDDQIGVLAREPESADAPAADGAVAGALTGGTLGLLAGAAVTAGLIPGVGPVLAGGLLASLVGGAAGATAGGLVGALIGLGFSEDQAHHYQSELAAGRVLVAVQGDGRLGEAVGILRRVEAQEAAPAGPTPDLEKLNQRP